MNRTHTHAFDTCTHRYMSTYTDRHMPPTHTRVQRQTKIHAYRPASIEDLEGGPNGLTLK